MDRRVILVQCKSSCSPYVFFALPLLTYLFFFLFLSVFPSLSVSLDLSGCLCFSKALPLSPALALRLSPALALRLSP